MFLFITFDIFGPFAVPFQQVALEPAGFRLPSLSVLLPPFYAMRKYRRLASMAAMPLSLLSREILPGRLLGEFEP